MFRTKFINSNFLDYQENSWV